MRTWCLQLFPDSAIALPLTLIIFANVNCTHSLWIKFCPVEQTESSEPHKYSILLGNYNSSAKSPFPFVTRRRLPFFAYNKAGRSFCALGVPNRQTGPGSSLLQHSCLTESLIFSHINMICKYGCWSQAYPGIPRKPVHGALNFRPQWEVNFLPNLAKAYRNPHRWWKLQA